MKVLQTMNEQYLSFYDYLQSNNFENVLNKLKYRYKDKKIILFGNYTFLLVVLKEFNITNYLNIVGLSNIDDSNVNGSDLLKNCNITIYSPTEIRSVDFDIILDVSESLKVTKQYLRQNHYVKKTVEINSLSEIPLITRIKNFINKQKYVFLYLKESKSIVKTVLYDIICNSEEIISKTNYLKKLKDLKTQNRKLKIAFVCSSVEDKNIFALYNLVKNDKDFNVYPIIFVPNTYLETESVNEECEEQKLQEFEESNKTELIYGWDKNTNDLTCLHAFKPDVIFYQNPIHIKNNFSPYKMSKTALTFHVQYQSVEGNCNEICSGYYKKQVSNMWKIFVQNTTQQNEFDKCTNLHRKDVTYNTHNKLNLKILEYLTKLKDKTIEIE